VPDLAAAVSALLGPPRRAGPVTPTLPSSPGLYAWWGAPGALPGITGPAHPTEPRWELLYVGKASSLHKRVVQNHLLGPSGSSTLRRALAGLLIPTEHWLTRWTSTRVVLVASDEVRLTAWMRTHLAVTVVVHDAPGTVEDAVIEELAPPLNVAGNTAHPAYPVVRAARAAWHCSAGPRP
jgi:hypothetical protein